MFNIPYKSNALMLNALIAGEIDVVFSDTALVLPHVNSGRLRTIGVTGLARMAKLPDVPTLKESGIADYYLTFWYGAWVPANTPAQVVTRLNELLAKAMTSAPAKAFLTTSGADVFDLSGEQFKAFENTEIAKFGKIVRGANIQPQ